MKCVICKNREAITTDCRCDECSFKSFSIKDLSDGWKYVSNGNGEIDKKTEIRFYKKAFKTKL